MFELVRAYETARNEKNKFLRFIYTKYTKYKLKKVFFDKFFNVYGIVNADISKELLFEFFQFFQCTYDEVIDNMNEKYPYISTIDIGRHILYIQYYDYFISVKVRNERYDIEIVSDHNHNGITIHPDNKYINLSPIREIILISIYNYCVAYIYGLDSDLCMHHKSTYIHDLFN